MAVRIRLKRMGAHKAPFYRVVVSDSVPHVTVVLSRRSVTTTRLNNRLLLRSMKIKHCNGFKTVHKHLTLSATCLAKRA